MDLTKSSLETLYWHSGPSKDSIQVYAFDMAENKYEREAQERWGDTDAYKESTKRAAKYTDEDWARYSIEQNANLDAFVAAMNGGLPSDSLEAKRAAEVHRLLIDQWFYPCSYDMQCNLAEMYLADARFTEFYDSIAPGLAKYVHDAIFANASESS